MKSALRNDFFKISLLLLATAVVCAACAWSLSWVYHFVASSGPMDARLIIPRYRAQIHPESDERFVFSVMVAASPVFCFVSVNLFLRCSTAAQYVGRRWLLAATLALFFLSPLLDFEFSSWLVDKTHVARYHTVLLLTLFSLSLLWYRTVGARPSANYSESRIASWAISSIFLVAVSVQISAWRVVSSRSVFPYGAWNVHFDAVIYTVSQVVAGKTLLADLPSQYGLFPEFIAPLFKVVGLSTFSFTAVCAVMQIVSMSCIGWVLQRSVRDVALRAAALIALVTLTFETVLYFIGIQERYFQYWPVRFFWPAVSVLAFYRYSKIRSLRSAGLVSMVGAVGALWNTDSGVMIVLAFAAFIAFGLVSAYLNDVTTEQRRRLWATMAIHLLINLLVGGAFFSYLTLKASGPLHLPWLYEYQVSFYKLGFTMLRMPMYPSAWMTVISVYSMGIIVGFVGIVRGRQSWRLDNIMFLSMLGVGLFIYYQGRSHILNLITVSWPAVLVGAMLADRVLRAVRAEVMRTEMLVLPAAALGAFAFCAAPFLWSIPKLVDDSVALFETRHHAISEVVQDEIRFIRHHSTPGEECAILSIRQGIYHAEARLASPLSGPGYIETVLQADHDSMLQQLKSKKPDCVFLGIGPNALDLGVSASEALKDYTVKATNESGTIQYLIPGG